MVCANAGIETTNSRTKIKEAAVALFNSFDVEVEMFFITLNLD